MEAARSVSSQSGTLNPLRAFQCAVLLMIAGIALVVGAAAVYAAPAGAQGVYGGSSYGSEIYSADPGEQEVSPPNTGFQMVAQAAREQPVLFWSSSAAIVLALVGGALAVRGIVKRKQEN